MKYFRRYLQHPAVFPVFLLVTLLAAYGYQITRLGFYWDDWQLVYLTSLKDPQVFWGFYAYDRPVAAWLYVALTPFLGINPVSWQVFAILVRWIGCLGFWVLFRQLWPERHLEAGFAALLMAVYPAFTQQPIAMTYSLFWVLYAMFIWSLVASLVALTCPKHRLWLTILAVLASLMETLSMEYVIGLELLRPALFCLVLLQLGSSWKTAIKQSLTRWIPYALVICVFVYYRFIYFPQIQTDPEANAPLLLREIILSPLTALPHLLQNMAQDLSQVLVFAWGKSITPAEIDFSQTTTLFAFGVGILLAAAAVILLRSSSSARESESGNDHFPLQGVVLGSVAVILGGLPVWSTNRQIITGMWSDRFSLGLMFGTAILFAGLAGWFAQKQTPRGVLLSIFLALGLAFQVQNTAKYRLNWDAQKDYYNQLAWRIPNLKAGTAILGNKVPVGLSAEYSTGFALNVIYPQDREAGLPFWFFSAISDRGGSIPDYVEGIPLKFSLRTISYDSSTSNGVAVYYKYGESCLRVLTPDDKRFPNLSDSESELLSISHPENILADGDKWILPIDVFGKELPHGWCYFFQKGDLSRQAGDWNTVVDILEETESIDLSPRNGTEYVPFIQALAHTGQWEKAQQLTEKGLELTGSARDYFCDTWEGLRSLNGGEVSYQKINMILKCGESR
ncbi:MAG: hypothetical protein GYA15_04080 [Leptolinea sp.]|jgi:hypothetical protein|nr:hypothetical protein [Leptolinea sp.]